MRWLEYGQRLRRQERGAFRDEAGRVAPALLHAATGGGGAALGVLAGRLEARQVADLVAIDLDASELAGL